MSGKEKIKLFELLDDDEKYQLILYTLSGKVKLQDIFEKYDVTEEEFHLLKRKILKIKDDF